MNVVVSMGLADRLNDDRRVRVSAKPIARASALHAISIVVIVSSSLRCPCVALVMVVSGSPYQNRIQQRGKCLAGGLVGAMAYSAAPLAERLGRALKVAVRLKLALLGGFQAQLDAGPALLLPTRKTEALLAYLALPLGQAHPREKLASRLWGDMPDAQARSNLRNALSRIRKALPRTARPGMVLDGRSVALNRSGAPTGR